MSDIQQEDSVNLTDPFGKVGSLPKSQANEALQNGYRMPSSEEIHSAKLERDFGGVQGGIFSGALGAARSATLGLSDVALENLPEGVGFSKEELNNFREANPNATAMGELAGILRDPFGLAKTIGAAGKATTEGAKSALKYVAAKEGETLAQKVLTSTFQHSVEGALYGGVAATVNDYALGDPSINGEKVLANMGYGYFLGGATGGAFKLLGYGITPAIKKGVNAIAELRNELIGSGYGEKALISKVLPDRISEAITDRQLNLDTKGQAANLRKIAVNLNNMTDSISDEVKNFETDSDPKAMSALFKSSSKMAGEAQERVAQYLGDTVDKLKSVIPDAKSRDSLDLIKMNMKYSAIKNSTAEAIFNGMKELRDKISEFSQKEPMLQDSMNEVTDQINGALKDPSVFGPAAAASSIHEDNIAGLRTFISDNTKNLTDFQKVFGEVKGGKWNFDIQKLHGALSEPDLNLRSANLSRLDDFYKVMKDMPDNMLNSRRAIPNSSWRKETISRIIENSQKSSEQAYQDYVQGISKRRPLYGWKDYAPVLIAKWHPVLAAAIEAYDWYQDPVHATHGLSMVERVLGQTTKKSLDLIDDIFDSSVTSRALIQNKVDLIKESDKDEKREQFKKYARDPDSIAKNMEKSTKELGEIAPNIAQHLNIQANNAASFLNSKLPQNNDHMHPLGGPMESSSAEKTKFENYRQVVENPFIALKQIKDRTLSPETIETLNSVYPKLYQQMKDQLLEKSFSQKAKNKPIPFQTRQAISMFLGQPLEQALSGQSIFANQQSFMPNSQNMPMGTQAKVRAKGLDDMKGQDRLKMKFSMLGE